MKKNLSDKTGRFALFFFIFSHTVSDSYFCKNIFGLRRVILNLAADIRHIYTKDLIISIRVWPPHIREDRGVGDHFTGILRQVSYDLVFDWSQVDVLIVYLETSL